VWRESLKPGTGSTCCSLPISRRRWSRRRSCKREEATYQAWRTRLLEEHGTLWVMGERNGAVGLTHASGRSRRRSTTRRGGEKRSAPPLPLTLNLNPLGGILRALSPRDKSLRSRGPFPLRARPCRRTRNSTTRKTPGFLWMGFTCRGRSDLPVERERCARRVSGSWRTSGIMKDCQGATWCTRLPPRSQSLGVPEGLWPALHAGVSLWCCGGRKFALRIYCTKSKSTAKRRVEEFQKPVGYGLWQTMRDTT